MKKTSLDRGPKQVVLLIAVVILIIAIPPVRRTLGDGLALLAEGKLGHFQRFLLSLGAWAPAVSIALMTAQALLVPVPITIIMIANGLVFGLWTGMLVSLAGCLTGALAAYGVARWLGRAIVERLLPASSLVAADRLMAKYGSWAVVISRWIPGVPADPMSYASGLTRMGMPKFLALTALGLVPANLVTAFVGTEISGDIPLGYWIAGWAALIACWIAWRKVASARSARASRRLGSHP